MWTEFLGNQSVFQRTLLGLARVVASPAAFTESSEPTSLKNGSAPSQKFRFLQPMHFTQQGPIHIFYTMYTTKPCWTPDFWKLPSRQDPHVRCSLHRAGRVEADHPGVGAGGLRQCHRQAWGHRLLRRALASRSPRPGLLILVCC